MTSGVGAGTYRFVLDCIVVAPVDVKFELMHRRGTDSVILSTWSKHFEPLSSGAYDAQPYEASKQVDAIDVVAGDLLVFRYTASNTKSAEAWIPNGDGHLTNGRIPYIELPK